MLNYKGSIVNVLSVSTANEGWQVAFLINGAVGTLPIAAWAHVRTVLNDRDAIIPLVAGRSGLIVVEENSIIVPPNGYISKEQLQETTNDGTFSIA
jgi:hypothetical protein